jgi:anti-sigma B factor antagonist
MSTASGPSSHWICQPSAAAGHSQRPFTAKKRLDREWSAQQNTRKVGRGILRRDTGGTMHDDVLRVDVSHVDGMTLVTAHGEIDANSALTLRALLDQLGLERRVLLDMAGVEFMDSSGLHVLLTQGMRMSETGGAIHICNPSRAVRRVVETTALCEVLFEPEALPDARESACGNV